jgi:alpha-L-rhamnosidase
MQHVRRVVGAGIASALSGALGLGLAVVAPPAHAVPEGTAAPVGLETADLVEPVGIDDTTPDLSWQLGRGWGGGAQAAYQVRVASTAAKLAEGQADLWDTGRVASNVNHGVTYDGTPLTSRSTGAWQVRVWGDDDQVSPWSEPASFELGLVDEADWSADWIGNPTWEAPSAHPMPAGFTAVTGRYVRLSVSALEGAVTDPFAPDREARLQLAELQVFNSADPSANFALGAPVVASESEDTAGEWSPQYLTDGETASTEAPRGYSSESRPALNIADDPITLTLDLGQSRTFNQARIFTRNDLLDQYARTANRPRDYQIQYSDSPDGPWAVARSATREQPPSAQHPQPDALPVFAKSFDLPGEVASARLYATGMGIYAPTINGEPVSDAVLEPADTDLRDRVVASTYDVTSLLTSGENRLAAEMGTGMAKVSRAASNRYQYLGSHHSPPRLLAQLEVTLKSGQKVVVDTDGTWRTTLGATTSANWYGGETYDYRREVEGWKEPGTTAVDAWPTATVTTAAYETTEVVGRTAPPIEPVDVLEPVNITNPSTGVYVVDFGINIAGWPQLTADGPAGTQVQMYPAEQLNTTTGAVLQTQYSGRNRVWQSFYLDGDGPKTWHPQFTYNGFRYVEITGLTRAPTADEVRAIVLRTTNERAGEFASSNPLLNSIHTISDRAMQGNMYSVMTDCPHREKLAWTEQLNLVYDSVAKNYDMEAHLRKIMQDLADGQTEAGLVPDFTPEHTEFMEFDDGYRDDANWGGSMILVPWYSYQTYGDPTPLRQYYANMTRYLDYLGGRADGFILGGGLGDWITPDTTPAPIARDLVATQAYHKLARTLGEVAATIGKTADAEKYATLASNIRSAFIDTWFDAETGKVGPGNQAAYGLALDEGLVPADRYDEVLDLLIGTIRAKDNLLTVGEIALPAILDVLADNGRDDVILDIATQKAYPSFGYFVETGSTALPEAWTGMTKSGSQNHYMLAALDDWFWSGLGGIEQAEGSIAFRELVIAPSILEGLTSNTASYDTPQGEVSTEWTLDGGRLTLDVVVPANTTATIELPLDQVGGADALIGDGALTPVARDAEKATYEVGPGSYSFVASANGDDDTVAPETAFTVSPEQPDGAEGWYVSAPSYSVSATDAGTGVATVEHRQNAGEWQPFTAPVTLSEDGAATVEYRATDAAGNVSPTGSRTLRVDRTPPTTTATVRGAVVTLAATDAASGVAGSEYRIGDGAWQAYTAPVTVPGTAPQTVGYRSTDKAGLVEQARSVAVRPEAADTTRPVIRVAGVRDGATYPASAVRPLRVNVTDAGGVASVVATLDGRRVGNGALRLRDLSLGGHRLVVTATDRAGNRAVLRVRFATRTGPVVLTRLVGQYAAEGTVTRAERRVMERRLVAVRKAVAQGRTAQARTQVRAVVRVARGVRNPAASRVLVRNARGVLSSLR